MSTTPVSARFRWASQAGKFEASLFPSNGNTSSTAPLTTDARRNRGAGDRPAAVSERTGEIQQAADQLTGVQTWLAPSQRGLDQASVDLVRASGFGMCPVLGETDRQGGQAQVEIVFVQPGHLLRAATGGRHQQDAEAVQVHVVHEQLPDQAPEQGFAGRPGPGCLGEEGRQLGRPG